MSSSVRDVIAQLKKKFLHYLYDVGGRWHFYKRPANIPAVIFIQISVASREIGHSSTKQQQAHAITKVSLLCRDVASNRAQSLANYSPINTS